MRRGPGRAASQSGQNRLRLESEILIGVGRHCYSGRRLPAACTKRLREAGGKKKKSVFFFVLFFLCDAAK